MGEAMTRGGVEGGGGMGGWAGSGEVLCAVYGQPHRDSGSLLIQIWSYITWLCFQILSNQSHQIR